MSTPFLDPDGCPVSTEQLLGYGGTGVVILRDQVALKIPLRYQDSSAPAVDENSEAIQREQEVYKRLERCNGVVSVIDHSSTTIQMAFMENGDLRSYLAKHQPLPSRSLQLSWLREMAHALACIHSRSVIVADIASRNLLLDSNLSIRFCDFTEASIMPLDDDIETVEDDGYSVQTDIGQLGAIFYEVVTGERCRFDVYYDLPMDASEAIWPPRESLPSTDGLWLGSIIERCWTKGGYRNAGCLAEALDSISLGHDEQGAGECETRRDTRKKVTLPLDGRILPKNPMIALMVAVGIVGVLGAWFRRK